MALSHRTRDGGLEPPATERQIQEAFEHSLHKWADKSKEKTGAETVPSEVQVQAARLRVKKKSGPENLRNSS